MPPHVFGVRVCDRGEIRHGPALGEELDVKTLSSALGRAAESIKVRYMGLGFVLAWIYCLWFSGSVLGEETRSPFVSLLPSMAGSGLVLLALALRPGPKRVPGERWSVLAPAAMSASTIMLFLVGPGPLCVACSLVGGVASAFLWLQWGDMLCRLEQETLENNMSALALLTVAIAAVVSNLPHVPACFCVAALPLLSGAMLLTCKGAQAPDQAGRPAPCGDAPSLPGGRLALLVPLVLCSAVCAGASSLVIVTAGQANSLFYGGNVIAAFIGGGPVAVMLFFVTLFYANRIDFSFMYRWLAPLLVISLACMSLDSPPFGAAGVLLAGSVAFMTDCFFVIVFVRLCRVEVCEPVESFGLFRAGVQLGASLGVALGAALSWAGIPLLGAYQALICICVFIPIVVVMTDRRIDAATQANGDEKGTEAAPQTGVDLDSVLAEKYRLSPREREVVALFARGRSVPYIRETLCISKNTIETHLKHAYTKMGVHSKQELLDLLDCAQ